MMSSLSALLVSAYINNLIKFSASFHNYYRWYYIANAWLELALVKTNGNVRGYGFEDTVAANSTTVSNNFSGANISFSTTTRTSALTLWDANTSKSWSSALCWVWLTGTWWYEIAPGWCVPIILLKDKNQSYFSGWEGKLELITDDKLDPVSLGSSSYPTLNLYGSQWVTALLTLLKIENNQIAYDYGRSILYSTLPQNNVLNTITLTNTGRNVTSNTKEILMIANTSSATWIYCIESNIAIPTQYVTIDAKGTYSNVTLDLKWVRKAWLPADFCYTAISS